MAVPGERIGREGRSGGRGLGLDPRGGEGEGGVQAKGETFAEGDLAVAPEKSPKHLTFRFPAKEQTDVMIYLRIGDTLMLCGHRDSKTRPGQFETGTKQGGEFLTVWERVK